MSWKWIGAIFIIIGCGGFGFLIAAAQRREEEALRQLIWALDYMECELQYRMTPLPDLCAAAAKDSRGCVREVLIKLSRELEAKISPDVNSCMCAALADETDIPTFTRDAFVTLGQSLGRFDMEGQLKGLELVRSACRRQLEVLTTNKETRLRSYQTLGLCTGAALAILLI